jgi:hypothetical protein
MCLPYFKVSDVTYLHAIKGFPAFSGTVPEERRPRHVVEAGLRRWLSPTNSEISWRANWPLISEF